MNLDLLSRLSSVLVSIDGGPTWAWVVLAVALSAYVIWTEHRARKRIGSVFPTVENAYIPDDPPAPGSRAGRTTTAR